MTLKNKITTLKNLIEMRQMTLIDPKFDIKKTRDTLLVRTRTHTFNVHTEACALSGLLLQMSLNSNIIVILLTLKVMG